MPFYRSPEAGPLHQGSGLGLAIAKGFIEAGGGTIQVESLPGQGTSFVVDLPVGPAAPALGAPDPFEDVVSSEPAAPPSQPVSSRLA